MFFHLVEIMFFTISALRSKKRSYLTLYQLLGHFNGRFTERPSILGTDFCTDCEKWRIIVVGLCVCVCVCVRERECVCRDELLW